MKEQNLWRVVVVVFVISIALFLACGAMTANANDRDGQNSLGYGNGDRDKAFDHKDGDIGNLFVTADTVLGGGPPPLSGIPCTLTNRFYTGNTIIFRIRVVDDNYHFLNDEKLTEVYVRIIDTGEEKNAEWGTHPQTNPTDAYWTVDYEIPDGMTGSFSYEVVAIAPKHRVGTFRPFDVGSSLLTISPPPSPPSP